MPFISRGVAPLVLSILVAASGIGCVDISAGESAYVDTVEKRFTVTGTPTLNLGTFDGSVEVETWNRPEVLVKQKKKVSVAEIIHQHACLQKIKLNGRMANLISEQNYQRVQVCGRLSGYYLPMTLYIGLMMVNWI